MGLSDLFSNRELTLAGVCGWPPWICWASCRWSQHRAPHRGHKAWGLQMDPPSRAGHPSSPPLPQGTHTAFFRPTWPCRFKVSKARGQLSTFLNITECSGCSKHVSWLFCPLESVRGPLPWGRLGGFSDHLCRGLFVAVKPSFPSWEWASGWGNSRHLETVSCNKQAQNKLASRQRPQPFSVLAGFPVGRAGGPKCYERDRSFPRETEPNKDGNKQTKNPKHSHTPLNPTT